jgi:hypothetical protein
MVFATMIAQAVTLAFTVFAAVSVLLFKGRPFLSVPARPSAVLFVVAAVALLAAVYLLARRDTYLPFLGEAAFPGAVLAQDPADPAQLPAGSERTLRVVAAMPPGVPDGSLVVYWASRADTARDGKVVTTPREAYAGSTNAGVARVVGGRATFLLACPTQYAAGGRTLKRHVHYRVQAPSGAGLFGPVLTMQVQC